MIFQTSMIMFHVNLPGCGSICNCVPNYIAGSEVLKGNIWVLISCFVCEHASWMSLGNIAVYNAQVRIQKQWLIQWCVDEQSYSKAWDCNQQCFRYKMFFQDQWHIVTRCRRSWPFLIIGMLGHSIVTAWRKKQLHPLKKSWCWSARDRTRPLCVFIWIILFQEQC